MKAKTPRGYGYRAARAAWLAGAGVMAMTAAPAWAQEGAPDSQTEPPAPVVGDEGIAADTEIVVTGTSLRGTAPVGTTVQLLDNEALEQTGISNVTDVLRTVPQVISLGADEGRGGGIQGAQGNVTQSKTVNLRGLGAESTLVLLNGRRIVQSGTQGEGYDLGVFPVNAIGRLEVVADGSSAIYGSDAVGGVINVITRRRYEGAQAGIRYGFADGFDEWRATANAGLTWEGGELFFAYQHYERGGLLGNERDVVTQDLRPFGGPDLRATFASPGTVVVGSTTYATPSGTRGIGLTGAQFIAGTANREDINDSRSLLVDQNQDIFFGSVRQRVAEPLTLWLEGYYSNRAYDGFGSSLNRGAPTATLVVPRSNPFFVHPTDPAAASVNVRYSFADSFPSRTEGGEKPFQIAGGLSWETFGDWVVDGFVSYSGNNARRRAVQLWSYNLAAVLADPNPATAFNPFCDTRAFSDCNNPATLDLLEGYNIIAGRLRATDVVAKANGTLFDLPGGRVALAVGGEYYDADLDTTITTLTNTATPNVTVTPSERSVKSAFAEILVPIFGRDNAVPGIQRLELAVAVRHEDYSDFGGTTNPKFGLRYDPTSWLSLRASYGTSFRAPSLADIDFAATATYNSVTIFDPTIGANIRAISLVGARPGLGPESAETWTVGADLTPLRGLRASFTYYNIDYTDRLTSVSTTSILANSDVFGDLLVRNPSEAEVLAYMNSPFFRSPPEDPANIVAIIDGRTSNLGGERQSGIDGSINYAFSALDSDWNVGLNFTRILEAEQSPAAGLPYVDVLDRINYPVDLRARAYVGWTRGNVSLNAFLNYVDGYVNDVRTPAEQVGSWTTLDLSFSIEAPENGPAWMRGLRFTISMINATDADPPLVINTISGVEGGYDSQNASAIGRFVAFELTKRF